MKNSNVNSNLSAPTRTAMNVSLHRSVLSVFLLFSIFLTSSTSKSWARTSNTVVVDAAWQAPASIQPRKIGGALTVQHATDQFIQGLPADLNLEELRLSDMHLTSNGVSDFRKWPRMKRLLITNQTIDDQIINEITQAVPKLEELYLESANITDDALANLAKLSHLKVLDVSHAKVREARALREFASLRSLRDLRMPWTTIDPEWFEPLNQRSRLRWFTFPHRNTDEWLRHTNRLPLSSIGLSGTAVTNEAAKFIVRKQSRKINVSSTRLTYEGLKDFRQSRWVHDFTAHNLRFDEQGLKIIAARFNRLTRLDIAGTQVRFANFTGSEFSKVRQLNIDGLQMSPTDMAQLGKAFPKLQVLSMNEVKAQGAVFREMRKTPLSSLSLLGATIDQHTIESIAQLQKLRTLQLNNVNNLSLVPLLSNKSLSEILIQGQLDSATIEEFRKRGKRISSL